MTSARPLDGPGPEHLWMSQSEDEPAVDYEQQVYSPRACQCCGRSQLLSSPEHRRSLRARGTPANVRRSRSCRRFARRHSSSTPRLHRRNRSAFRARGAPTGGDPRRHRAERRVPRARGPDPLRAPCDSGSCPSRFSSSKSVPSAGPGVPSAPDAVPSALPGFQDGRTFAAIGPTRGRGERGFPVLRRHRPEVLCGGADHDSGRVLKRHGMRHPPAPG